MQFIPNGPDIPEELLRAHEEGRVVFFCGAGISYPAGLPGFQGLVDDIYVNAGTTLKPIEQVAYDRGQFDATLDLLERRLPGQRTPVRQALMRALKPNLRRKGATDTHAALLRLARDRAGRTRLVTTNFDRVFDAAAKRTGQPFQSYSAPMLPIPKNSRWDGLVYLHGELPLTLDETALNRLVVTSGDFGLAYLTERWAARFVSELFRNYIVCFVGYSINDPVLRYMMDALAADRMLGEVTPQAWALGDCQPGQEADKTVEWEAKGVSPILYEVPSGTHDHSALHATLQVWADTYRDGITGKERIVISHALAKPTASTRQDDFVGRMLWALSDESGLPAKQFADFNPAPSLDWLLHAFADPRYRHGDLNRYGVPPHAQEDTKLKFSLVNRPSPYQLAPNMLLVALSNPASRWDPVMFQLARWLIRHLNDPRLIIWIAEQGGQIHEQWPGMIEDRLSQLARLEQEGLDSELNDIRNDSPNAVPSVLMRKLWRVLLTGRVKSSWMAPDLYRWQHRLSRDGISPTLRMELRELLAPRVLLKKALLADRPQGDTPVASVRQLVDWEIVLASEHVHSFFKELQGPHWTAALPTLLDDLQLLLTDALDLFAELGEADRFDDRSSWDLPSISEHWQNRGFHDWVVLVELLRDAWLAINAVDEQRAAKIAEAWFDKQYPTYKRLALFAATQNSLITPEQWHQWLLLEERWWLWTLDCRREVLRLMVLKGAQLSGQSQQSLERAILLGPPRAMYRDDLEPERWEALAARQTWLYLAKLAASGLPLTAEAAATLEQISITHPQWRLATNERDEFSHWMSGSGDPDYEDDRHLDIAPHKRSELVAWLQLPPPQDAFLQEDTWREVVKKHLLNAVYALRDLAQKGIWPATRWREALQAWSEPGRVLRSWRYAAPVLLSMPEPVLAEIAHSLTYWLKTVARSLKAPSDTLMELCRKILQLPLSVGTGITENGQPLRDPIGEAINHPIGHVTEALLEAWLAGKPNDNALLPTEISEIFTRVCDTQVLRYRHARVILGSRLIVLYRVDSEWTTEHLLPLFDWSTHPGEAQVVWQGFLWSPRLYRPLLLAFKAQFLATAHHYDKLGEHAQQFAGFITYAALGPIEGYTWQEFREAIAALPPRGLQESAQALAQALEGAAEQREEYWRNRIQPFWQQVWPKNRDSVTPRIVDSLVRMSIAAGKEFPAAFSAIRDWLLPLEHSNYIVHVLETSGLCTQYPLEALNLLARIIDEKRWVPRELGQCLQAIALSSPALAHDPYYRRLMDCVRRSGN